MYVVSGSLKSLYTKINVTVKTVNQPIKVIWLKADHPQFSETKDYIIYKGNLMLFICYDSTYHTNYTRASTIQNWPCIKIYYLTVKLHLSDQPTSNVCSGSTFYPLGHRVFSVYSRISFSLEGLQFSFTCEMLFIYIVSMGMSLFPSFSL